MKIVNTLKSWPLYRKITVGVFILCLIQIVILFVLKADNIPTEVRLTKEIEQIKESGIAEDEAIRLRLQMSLDDYIAVNGKANIRSLSALIPDFIDYVPLNPKTGKEYQFAIVKGQPTVFLSREELPQDLEVEEQLKVIVPQW